MAAKDQESKYKWRRLHQGTWYKLPPCDLPHNGIFFHRYNVMFFAASPSLITRCKNTYVTYYALFRYAIKSNLACMLTLYFQTDVTRRIGCYVLVYPEKCNSKNTWFRNPHIAVENLLSNLQMMSQVPSLQSNIVLARSKKCVCTRNWQTFYQLRSRSG